MNDTIGRRRHLGREALVAAILALALPILGIGAFFAVAQSDTASATPTPCPAATPTSATPTTDLCVEIGEYDIYFEPNLITIPADTPVRVVLNNHGTTMHNFSVTDHENSGLKNLDISIDTDPGKTTETTINAPEGTYYFFCSVPGHEQAGMRGYIEVKKDAPIATSSATVTPRAG
jgi:nitrite reductase (NO-forming)